MTYFEKAHYLYGYTIFQIKVFTTNFTAFPTRVTFVPIRTFQTCLENCLTSKNSNLSHKFMIKYSRTIWRNMSVFTQKLNPLTGKCDWEVQDENYDYHQEIARSSFADMLHDKERNQKYFLGIQTAIQKMHSMGKKANVLDIGTGTGLLSMMAVQCGADSVTAIEGFRPVADCAKNIIKTNGFESEITIISKCSLDVKVGADGDMERRCNILVTEIFDTELIGEGAIKTFSHAHRELLERDCIVIPTSATVYAQVVESPLACNWRKLKTIVDPEEGFPLLNIPKIVQDCVGTPAVHDIQLNQFPVSHFRTIIPPVPIFQFDWSGKTKIIKERSELHTEKASHSGNAQVVFVWWDLKMDPDKKIILSCAPYWTHPDILELAQNTTVPIKDVVPWRDHWMQAVYFLPQDVRTIKGDELTLISNHDEYSFWFNLKNNSKIENTDYLKPSCDCGIHFIASRTRIGQINDSTRNKKYINVLKNKITSNTVCLNLSDGSLLGVIAAKLGAKQVYNIENSCMFLKNLQQFAKENGVNDRIRYFNSMDDFLKENLQDINLVIAEPNYIYSLLPWDNLHFIYQLKNVLVDKIPASVDIMPRKAVIKAMGVRFLHLHKIKASLEKLEGFKMAEFDHMIKVHIYKELKNDLIKSNWFFGFI